VDRRANEPSEESTKAWERPLLVRLSSSGASENGIVKGYTEAKSFPTKGGGAVYGYTPASP